MILVTGATGKIGRLVVQHLLNKGVPVRVFVRNERAFDDVENPSLELAIGTFEDTKSIEKAVEGVDRIFLVARDNPEQVSQHDNVIKVAEQCGVNHIVKLSAFGASRNSPIALMRWHAETEKQLRNSKLNWTFLRPHLYMQNLLRFGTQVATGSTFSAPMGSHNFALVDIRDIAEVAAKVLVDSDHVSKVYTLTGPSAITFKEIAEHLSDIFNQSINYNQLSPEEFYQMLLSNETPSWRAYDLAYIAEAYPGDRKSLITNDTNILLNRPARSIRTFLSDYQTTFQSKQ
ncbi:SDR family oxidoreductase [Virgibacillus ihumii]|uniref:SDR family oxidoreductase n=1 Tax=Virgibacillus ihumii TaxID=2686091 RepID=UPI00157BF78E|nr:SDR family oxidoreductase [Virgibacillus ihumii]